MAANGSVLPPEAQPAPPTQSTVHFAGPEGTHLRFSGPPHQLRGKVGLVNTGPEKQKLRTLSVNSENLLGAARLPLREFPFYARLEGGQQASVPITIRLDPQTPPGEYDFELAIADRVVPATAHVAEVVDLHLDPPVITILAGASTTYTRTVVAENRGNVPLALGAQCEEPLYDPRDFLGSLITGLHDSDKDSLESMVKSVLEEWAGLQVGTLIIKRQPMILSPGQKRAGELEFQLPAGLKPLRHYKAFLQLYNAALGIEIYTSAKAGSGGQEHSNSGPAVETNEQIGRRDRKIARERTQKGD